MKIRVGVLYGGKTTEHEVSIITAVQAMNNLNKEKYDVVPLIIKKIPYNSIMLTNKEYNSNHDKYNMNKVKAILHNKMLYKTKMEHPNYEYIVVDQFAEKYVNGHQFAHRGRRHRNERVLGKKIFAGVIIHQNHVFGFGFERRRRACQHCT